LPRGIAGGDGKTASLPLSLSSFLSRYLSFSLPFPPFADGNEDWGEREERNSLPRGWRSRSLALLTRLTAWSARLEPSWFIGKEEWIFIRNCEIVASLVPSPSHSHSRPRCTLVSSSSRYRQDARFSFSLSLSLCLSRLGFLDFSTW